MTKKRKAEGNALGYIVAIVIALVVIIIVIVIFTQQTNNTSNNLASCTTRGGDCVADADCGGIKGRKLIGTTGCSDPAKPTCCVTTG